MWRQERKDQRRLPVLEVSDGINASRTAADVVEKYSRELMSMRDDLATMREEIRELQNQLEAKDEQIEKWQRGIERLIGQVVSLGHEPVWRPEAK